MASFHASNVNCNNINIQYETLAVRQFVFCKRRLTAAPEQAHMFCIVKGKEGIQYQLAEEESKILKSLGEQRHPYNYMLDMFDRFIGYMDVF